MTKSIRSSNTNGAAAAKSAKAFTPVSFRTVKLGLVTRLTLCSPDGEIVLTRVSGSVSGSTKKPTFILSLASLADLLADLDSCLRPLSASPTNPMDIQKVLKSMTHTALGLIGRLENYRRTLISSSPARSSANGSKRKASTPKNSTRKADRGIRIPRNDSSSGRLASRV